MNEQPEKFDLSSHHITEGKQQEVLRLFPEIRTEGGKIDFERLKLALGGTVDTGKERYGMTWPGKADCFKAIQSPSLGTLRPCPEENVNFDTTENLIIEGDNLEVLKLLQKSYLGKVKMIYIDPPYNTGNDFIYPDNYTESLQTYLAYTGQVDAQGKRFGTNTEADGRFHSRWLNMMYPRLYLARNLLREDGVTFISVDDHEVDNLRKLCSEIFGEENFVGQLTILCNPKGRAQDKHFATNHEFILVFSKNQLPKGSFNIEKEAEQIDLEYTEEDDGGKFRTLELRNTHREFGRFNRKNLYYPLYVDPENGDVQGEYFENSIEVFPRWEDGFEGCWTWGSPKAIEESEFLIGKNVGGNWKVYIKDYANGASKMLKTILGDKAYFTEKGQKSFNLLFQTKNKLFQSPKSVELLSHLLKTSTEDSDIILDFFAGSGTAAHAVLDLNQRDGGNRKFILVQLPEPTGRKEYPTIADICKERVRRVIKKLNDSDAGKLDLDGAPKQDRGFRVFKLAESNFKPWNAQGAQDAEALEKQLELHINHVLEGRTAEDILYEILLKSGYPLTTPMEKLTLAGKTVHNVAGGELFICLEHKLTLELIRAMAARKPQRVVCLDEGFAGNDQLKANAVQIFKTKGVPSFKTV